jgi:hypothetical protein
MFHFAFLSCDIGILPICCAMSIVEIERFFVCQNDSFQPQPAKMADIK